MIKGRRDYLERKKVQKKYNNNNNNSSSSRKKMAVCKRDAPSVYMLLRHVSRPAIDTEAISCRLTQRQRRHLVPSHSRRCQIDFRVFSQSIQSRLSPLKSPFFFPYFNNPMTTSRGLPPVCPLFISNLLQINRSLTAGLWTD